MWSLHGWHNDLWLVLSVRKLTLEEDGELFTHMGGYEMLLVLGDLVYFEYYSDLYVEGPHAPNHWSPTKQ